jgi:hypothetical protein
VDWKKEFGVDPKAFPPMKIFALNACPTLAEDLPGNASILALSLAESIQRQGGKAEAYGLLVSGVVEQNLVKGIDLKMNKVLKDTEPSRVRASMPSTDEKLRESLPAGDSIPTSQPNPSAAETSLDIILTGAGELGDGSSNDSIFCRLAREEEIDLHALRRNQRLVGDLGYAPLSSTGDEVELFSKGKAQVFYSVASLHVFNAVAEDQHKAVILVARRETGKDKAPIVRAAIGASTNSKQYVSYLVVDEPTADAILWG